jgi:hypothetical protein
VLCCILGRGVRVMAGHEHADTWCVSPGVHLCDLCEMPLQLCCARRWHTRSRRFQSVCDRRASGPVEVLLLQQPRTSRIRGEACKIHSSYRHSTKTQSLGHGRFGCAKRMTVVQQ